DRVDVRLLHHLQELARVRGERLDVPALSLGIDRVEGEARLAGARKPGDADEGIPREPDRDVLQVVLPGAVDDQLVGCHGSAIVSTERLFVQASFGAPSDTQAVRELRVVASAIAVSAL